MLASRIRTRGNLRREDLCSGIWEIAAFIFDQVIDTDEARPSLIDYIWIPTPISREVSCWYRDPGFPICHIHTVEIPFAQAS